MSVVCVYYHVKCILSRGHSVHDMVYYAIWNCTSINLVNNEQTPSAKNLWCQTCLHLKGSRCKNHILKCITIPGSDYKNATTHFIHFSSLVTYYFSNNKNCDASHERLVMIQFPVKYRHLKTLFYGFFKKFEFCQSSDFLKG